MQSTKTSEEMHTQELKSSTFNSNPIFQSTTSKSTNTIDKDTIIDNLQEQMGDYLQKNQELCSIRNQIEMIKKQNISLQSQLDQEKLISKQVPELQKEISEKSSIIVSLTKQVDDLKQANESLNSKVESLKQKIDQILQDSEKELKQKVIIQTNELRSTIEIKNNEIQSMKKLINELKAQNTSNNESIIQEKIEKERLVAMKADKEKQNAQFKEEIDRLTNKFRLFKEKHQKEKENTNNLMINLNKCQNEIAKYKQKEQFAKERNEKLEKGLQEAKSVIKSILSIRNPQFETIDELNNYIIQKKDENKALKNEIKDHKKTLKRFAVAIQNYEEQVSVLTESLANVKTADATLKSKYETQTCDFEKLNRKVQILRRKLAIIPVYENVTADLRNRLQEIISVVRPEVPEVTVRSLAVFVIMLKRWSSLPSISPKTYVKDSRNWWWMNPPDSQKLTSHDVKFLITSLKGEINKYKKLSEQLQYQIEQYDQQLKDSKKSVKSSTKTIRYNAHKIADLESQIEELQKLANYDIKSNSDYQKLIEKLRDTEIELEETQEKLRESEVEISDLQINLSKTKQQLSNQCLLTKQKERALEDTKYQLYGAQNGIINLKQGNNMRTKEILALERGIYKEQKKSALSNTQNAILTLENRRMNFQIANQNREMMSNSPDHQFVEQSPK